MKFLQNRAPSPSLLMQRTDYKEDKSYRELLYKIGEILMKKGLKSATMDSVASSLGISKRTLYELFDSKSEMIKEALHALEVKNEEFAIRVFSQSENVIEALVKIFKHHRDIVGAVNVDFYRDMDRLYKTNREDYDHAKNLRHQKMVSLYNLGVDQGMFRPDVDFEVQCHMMALQMEGIKRMEEYFPAGVSLQRVFDVIIVGFIRSIASEKGMRTLDSLI